MRAVLERDEPAVLAALAAGADPLEIDVDTFEQVLMPGRIVGEYEHEARRPMCRPVMWAVTGMRPVVVETIVRQCCTRLCNEVMYAWRSCC
jgi:hypothetical protein